MSYNQILKRKAVGEITKNGMNIAFSVATQTTHWTRPESVAEEVGERANPIVQGSKTALPTGTVELCIREPEHPSQPGGDPRDHITGVAFNKSGEGKSLHFETKAN